MKSQISKATIVVLLLSAVFYSSVLAASKYVGGVRCSATKTITTNWGYTWKSTI